MQIPSLRALAAISGTVLAVGLLGPGTGTNGQPIGAVETSHILATASQSAHASATAKRKANGKVAVRVVSSKKVVQVKFRTGSGKKKVRTKRTKHHKAAFTLPVSAQTLHVRARADRKKAGRGWVAVRIPALASPAPAKPSTPVKPRPPVAATPILATPTEAQLREVRATRIFFGHQSVGANILDGLATLYAAGSVPAPVVVEGKAPTAGGFGNAYIGANFNPKSKLSDFNAWIRNRGVGANTQVAFMKLCYVDVGAGFDANAWFAQYRSTLSALQAAYPKVVFLHVTAPLTTYSPSDNVARYKLNVLMRKEYASSGRLIDLAALESTRPDGSRVTGSSGGQAYEQLYEGYTSDGGHLNQAGAQRAASLVVRTIASAR